LLSHEFCIAHHISNVLERRFVEITSTLERLFVHTLIEKQYKYQAELYCYVANQGLKADSQWTEVK
jgi:hypothetical protein